MPAWRTSSLLSIRLSEAGRLIRKETSNLYNLWSVFFKTLSAVAIYPALKMSINLVQVVKLFQTRALAKEAGRKGTVFCYLISPNGKCFQILFINQ